MSTSLKKKMEKSSGSVENLQFSPMDRLLPDCKDHISRFLTLKECLSYGAVSRSSLQEILQNLRERRNAQFLRRYCYQIEQPSLLKPVSNSEHCSQGTQVDFSSKLIDKDHWHTIPSIFERTTSLYHAMPVSHPSNDYIRELISDLKDQTFLQNQSLTTQQADFPLTLKQLKRCTKAHRLHATILALCTIKSNPIPCSRYSAVNSNAAPVGPTSLSVSLDQYIGDVVCAYYLMGHAIAGIIEGSASHSTWTKHILSLLHQEEPHHALSWYKFWIYLHSTLLRSFPFKPAQMKTLLGSTCGIQGITIPECIDYVHPHYCYVGMEPQGVYETTKLVRTLLLQLGNDFAEPPAPTLRVAHQTTMNHFGPLGPAYRGRDEIRTRTMNPFSLLHRLHHPSYCIPTTWFLVEQKEHVILDSRTFQAWFSESDTVIRWMLELKQECSKSRPMTVMPPIVTIEPLPLSAFLSDNAIQ
jgi:hypothetical protein